MKADFLGSETLLYLMYQGQQVLVKFAGNVDVAVAEEVQVGWDEASVHFLMTIWPALYRAGLERS